MSLYNLPAGAIAAASAMGTSKTPSPETLTQSTAGSGFQPITPPNIPALAFTNGPQTLTQPNISQVNALNNPLEGISLAGIQDVGDAEDLTGATPDTIVPSSSADTRIRLRAIRGREDQVYGANAPDSNILSILHETDGLLFPYTPNISISQAVDYQSMGLVHTNNDIFSYAKTPSANISITAKFTVQNQREGRYLLAVMHLLRVVSKMYFGEADKAAGKAGLPPPVMIFSGYGNYMFNDIPVIVKSHSYSLDETVSTVTINTAGGVARLPAVLTISIELGIQQSPIRQRKAFSLDEFRTGALMRSSGHGWI